MDLGSFRAFRPVRRTEDSGEEFLADMGRHPHGYSSVFEWRFYEGWAMVRLRKASPDSRTAGPPKKVIYDWSPDKRFGHPGVNLAVAEEKMPPAALWADSVGHHFLIAAKKGMPFETVLILIPKVEQARVRAAPLGQTVPPGGNVGGE